MTRRPPTRAAATILCALVASVWSTAQPVSALPHPAPGHALPQITSEPRFGRSIGLPGGAPPLRSQCLTPQSCDVLTIDTSTNEVFATTETNGAWGAPQLVAGPVQGQTDWDYATGFSCPSPGSCTFLDAYATSSVTYGTTAVQESGGTWGASQAIVPPAAVTVPYAVHWSLSCSHAGDCTALGTYIYGETSLPDSLVAVASSSSGVWGAAVAISPPTLWKEFSQPSISCPAVGECAGFVGAISEPLGMVDYEPVSEHDGTWSLVRPTTLSHHAWYAVACWAVGDCLATGWWVTAIPRPGSGPAYVISKDGVWGAPHAIAIPTLSPKMTIGSLDAVSCGSASVCVAVGSFAYVNGFASYSASAAVTFRDGVPSSAEYAPGLTGALSCATATVCVGGAGSTLIVIEPGEHFARPGPPLALTARPSPGAVTVTWRPPDRDGGAPVISFTARLRHATTSCTVAAAAVDRCAIHGLVAGDMYRVLVTDVTAAGQSRPTSVAFRAT